jgi:hypothetical protein
MVRWNASTGHVKRPAANVESGRANSSSELNGQGRPPLQREKK